jgi:hypothetical protein
VLEYAFETAFLMAVDEVIKSQVHGCGDNASPAIFTPEERVLDLSQGNSLFSGPAGKADKANLTKFNQTLSV